MDNRFEEVPQKENGFVKVFKLLGKYFKNVGVDFVNSFKYNNMKLPALLVACPGVFLGFFLGFHSQVISPITYSMAGYVSNGDNGGCSYKIGFDYSGIVLFIMMLLGILNIFGATSMSGKKNFGSVMVCTLSTLLIIVCCCFYLYALAVYNEGASTQIKLGDGTGLEIESLKIPRCYIPGTKKFNPGSEWTWSIISVVISMVTSIVGCVLGFIFYDRTYEKVDR